VGRHNKRRVLQLAQIELVDMPFARPPSRSSCRNPPPPPLPPDLDQDCTVYGREHDDQSSAGWPSREEGGLSREGFVKQVHSGKSGVTN